MRVRFAFIAEDAAFNPETARFRVTGGGLEMATGTTVPSQIPGLSLSLVFGAQFERDEFNEDHEVAAVFVSPSGKPVSPGLGEVYPPQRYRIHPTPTPGLGGDALAELFIMTYATPVFEEWGRYEFRITVDGQQADSVHLWFLQRATHTRGQAAAERQ